MYWGIEVKDVVIFLVGLPFAVLISWYFFKRGLSRKQIVYAMKVEDLLFKGEQYPAQLKITYGDVPIDVLSKAEIYLWNGGNQPIVAADLKTGDKLRIVWPTEFQILEYSIRYQTRAANRIEIDSVDTAISFAYLNVGDGAVIDVVGARLSNQRIKPEVAYGEIKGEIIGAEKPPKREGFNFSVNRYYVPMMLFGFGMVSFVLYMAYTDSAEYLKDFRWWHLLPGAGLVLFLLVSMMFGVGGLVLWITVNRVPANLIVLEDRKLTLRERIRLYFK